MTNLIDTWHTYYARGKHDSAHDSARHVQNKG